MKTTVKTIEGSRQGLFIGGHVLAPKSGRYIDSFERHDGAWRFASREVEPRLFGDVSKHVAVSAQTVAA